MSRVLHALRGLGRRRGSSGRLSRQVAGAVLAAAVVVSACAPKLPPVPTVVTPQYPDLMFPAVPENLATTAADARHQRGWRFLQAGDLRNASREFQAALRADPGFFPAQAGLGDVALAGRDYKDGLAQFDRALKRSAEYVPALVGRGDALVGLSRTDEALKSFQAALARDPSLTEVNRRMQVLTFQIVQGQLAAARKAIDAGRYDQARDLYQRAIAASPDSAFLYRELGAVERKQGNDEAALEHFRRAASLDPNDARSLVQIGELLESSGDVDGALNAYRQAAVIEPGPAIDERLERVEERVALKRMPAEYRDIPASPQITRADLAALIGVRLESLLQSARHRETALITDARGSWASPWIVAVARAGVMEVYANHTFRPRAAVRRDDLAHAAARLLRLVAERHPEVARRWDAARPRISDVPAGHLSYGDVALDVAAGVMPLQDGDAFHLAAPVTGAEAIRVIQRIEALAR